MQPALVRLIWLQLVTGVPVVADTVYVGIASLIPLDTFALIFYTEDLGPAGLNTQYWYSTEQVELCKNEYFWLWFDNNSNFEVNGGVVLELI